MTYSNNTTRGTLTNEKYPHRQPEKIREDYLYDQKARLDNVASKDALDLGFEARRQEQGEPVGALDARLVLGDLKCSSSADRAVMSTAAPVSHNTRSEPSLPASLRESRRPAPYAPKSPGPTFGSTRCRGFGRSMSGRGAASEQRYTGGGGIDNDRK